VYNGNNIASTAHEAALYNQQLDGKLRTALGSLTHQNLPLAMFLERPDLGFSDFDGTATGLQTDTTILAYLGMGIVSYTDLEPPEPSEYDVVYRVNTEVVTSVTLHAMSEINPDAPATVTFTAAGRTYSMSSIVIPEGDSQVVWFKWTTPATEQNVTITVSTSRGYLSHNLINARVVDLNRNPPPDPKATDRNSSFSAVSSPSNPQRTSARWTVWWAVWHEFWEWEEDWQWVADIRWVSNWSWRSNLNFISDGEGVGYWVDNGWWQDFGFLHDFGQWFDFGEWVDNGWYDFFIDIYTASLTASSTIRPDDKVPTASGNTMKSGYGVNNTVTSSFSTNAPGSHVTGAQTAGSYFPEFRYTTYWRLLELMQRGFSSRLEFRRNPFSTYNQRSHFSPVWYPNGNYTVYTWLLDAWMPDGMPFVDW